MTLTTQRRMYRETDLVNMGITSAPGEIMLHVIRNGKTRDSDAQRAKSNRKKDMQNLFYPDYANSQNFTLEDAKQQLKDCEQADFIVSSGPKNESLASIKQRIALLKATDGKGKSKVFVFHYSADPGVVMLLQQEAAVADIIGIHIGSWIMGAPGYNRVCEKILYIKQMLQKPTYLFGVPTKMFGDSQKDVRFFPFHGLICEGWSRHWGKVVPGDDFRYVDREDYVCRTYEGCLAKFGPNGELPGINKTVHDFFNNGTYEERKKYEQVVLDEALAELTVLIPQKATSLLLTKMHRDFIDLFLMSWKTKQHYEVIQEITELVPAWDTPQNRSAINERLARVDAPLKVHPAARAALQHLRMNVEARQQPSFEAFLQVLEQGVAEQGAHGA